MSVSALYVETLGPRKREIEHEYKVFFRLAGLVLCHSRDKGSLIKAVAQKVIGFRAYDWMCGMFFDWGRPVVSCEITKNS